MKKFYHFLICCLLTASILLCVYADSSVPESVMDATESVVRILGEYAFGYSTGSGFVIKSDREETLIATNYHVVSDDPLNISVWISDSETIHASILAYSNQKDLCILKLAYPIPLEPLAFSQKSATQGEAVYAVGFPGAADYLSDKDAHTSADATITDGIVSAIREITVSGYGTPTKVLQINAAINPGNSGGPLFNDSGEVVGINTYGINDAQGIFGAIDISELSNFMADNSVPIPTSGNSFPWLLIVALAAAVCGLILLLFVVRKLKMKPRSPKNQKNIPLQEYMDNHSEGVGMNDAVALLLPVALQLRDLHNEGKAHLQVSPSSISVGAEGAVLADASAAETARYSSGYAAPEIYKGSTAGNRSDIYSFCALLSYVASGKPPVNSLSRGVDNLEENEGSLFDQDFADTLKVGMSLESSERFSSMQDLIIKLSAYNVAPFSLEPPASTQPETETIKMKPKRSYKKTVSIIAIVVVLAILGGYLGCYLGAYTCARNEDFDTANSLLFIPQFTNLHDPQLVSYIHAGQVLNSRQYTDAKNEFMALPGYLSADTLSLEADYRYALQLADVNNFDEAIKLMASLKKAGYKDSETVHSDLRFRKGVYLMQEEQDYIEANIVFTALVKENYDGAQEMWNENRYQWAWSFIDKEQYVSAYDMLTKIRGYANTEEVLENLTELIYLKGQQYYYEGEYDLSKSMFGCISPYLDSAKYLTLLEARLNVYVNPVKTVENLMDIFYFEDASKILLSTQRLAREFLCGEWRNGMYYFRIDEEYSCYNNLPRAVSGSYTYKIENGYYIVTAKDDPNDTYTQFHITAVSPTCIEIYCFKDKKTYALYWQ